VAKKDKEEVMGTTKNRGGVRVGVKEEEGRLGADIGHRLWGLEGG
jgi:hypothetical protein